MINITNMKRFFLLFVVSLFMASLQAAYLRDIPMTLTQPDGTVLHCYASGDEYFNYLHDVNGYTIIQHPVTGYYVYADKQDGKLIATDYIAGRFDPTSKNLKPYNLISPEEWRARRKAWEEPDKRPSNRDFVPNHGTLNNIVIFIRFADDTELTNSFSTIDNMFNNDSENAISLKSYFRTASYGAIDISTFFYPGHNEENIISYQDSLPRSYFQPYNANTNPNGYKEEQRAEREFDLLERAVNYINEYCPIPQDLDIDYDGDGYVDNICFIIKGNVGAWSSLLWPHKWSLYDRYVFINGKVIYTYNIQLANGSNFTTSTLCHEMNHSLSAPDLYHYNSTGLSPVGIWDLMATNTTPPQHCGAYMKMKYGHWVNEIPEISQAGTYTLNPISSATPDNIAYKIATADPNQFYVLEYRDKNSLFESGLPGSGLLIYRIDTRFHGNNDYDPSLQEYNEVYVFRPDGTFSSDGSVHQAHFSSGVGRTQFDATTNPYPFLSDGTLEDNLRIYDITETGSTISFKYGTNAACLPPVGLTTTVVGRNVTLTWEAADNAISYNVYRNNSLIGNTSTTNYTDADLSYGTHTYFIKSIDDQALLSTASESVDAVICPIPTIYSVTTNDNDAIIMWDEPQWVYPEFPLHTLTHGTQEITDQYIYWKKGGAYWGHRHTSESLSSFDGMKLYSVEFYAYNAGKYQLLVYEGSTITSDDYTIPTQPVRSQSLTVSSDGWHSVDLDEPVVIDGEQDLWLFIHDSIAIPYVRAYVCNASGYHGCYYSSDLLDYTSYYNNYAFLIKTYLTDGTYSYNLYDNSISIANNISQTSHTVENVIGNTIHHYTVTTNYSGGESTPSNTASLAIGSHTLNNLDLGLNNLMTIAEGSTLTVSGLLSNNDPEQLIIENGAQLINRSEGVKATVKKTIQPFTENKNDGWNLIASPITDSLDAEDDIYGLLENDYDLYAFDQSGVDENNNPKEWRNYKANDFNFNHTAGYLYANSEEITLSFPGTLSSSDSTTTLRLDANTDFSGFNLIGNPYPCNVNTTKPFYVLQYNAEEDNTSFVLGSNPIPPCAAVLVQAQTNNETVSFSKVPIAEPSAIVMQLSEQKLRSNTTLDQARISFEEQCQLTKYTWGKASSTIYIPQNGQNYAVAYVNGQNEMPVNFKAAKNGTYTLGFEVKDLNLNYLHLIDNMTGTEVDLLATASYTFEGKTTDYESRFRLVFACEDADSDNEYFAYYANGEIVITGIADAFDASLQIVDMMGRIITTRVGRIQCVPTSGITAGVYVLRLINGNEVKTQKIVIE